MWRTYWHFYLYLKLWDSFTLLFWTDTTPCHNILTIFSANINKTAPFLYVKTGSQSTLVVHDSILASNLFPSCSCSFVFDFSLKLFRAQWKGIQTSACMIGWILQNKKSENSFYFSLSFYFFIFFLLFLSFSRWHGQTLTQVGCGFRSADISLYCSFHPSYQRTFQVYLLTFFRFYVSTSAFPPFKVTTFFCLSFTSVLSYRSIAVLLIDVESVRKRKEKNRERQKL